MQWRILAVLLLAPCLAAALAFGATHTVDSRPVGVSVDAQGVVWANRIFTTRRQLAAWLNVRGASYQTWARRHPIAARSLRQ